MTLPVPTQRTWTVGDFASAAMLNSNVRDAVNFLAGPPIFQGLQATTQSLTTGIWTNVNFDTNVFDSYSGHSTVTNNNRYTCQVAGTYMVLAQVPMATSVNTHRGVVVKNGGVVNGSSTAPISSTSTIATDLLYVPTLVPCVVGDWLGLQVFQDSGGSISTINTAGRQACISILWVHS